MSGSEQVGDELSYYLVCPSFWQFAVFGTLNVREESLFIPHTFDLVDHTLLKYKPLLLAVPCTTLRLMTMSVPSLMVIATPPVVQKRGEALCSMCFV